MEGKTIRNNKSDFQRDSVIRVHDAVIENIKTSDQTGYVTISYEVLTNNERIDIAQLVLIVDTNTIIVNQYGRRLRFADLEIGMVLDALVSAMMTRSIPPQSRAYRIVLLHRMEPTSVIIDRVLSVDPRNNWFYTGEESDIMTQMRFVVPRSAVILDQDGNRISLRALRPGDVVRVEHANFQTASIPPQTTAIRVRIL